MIKINIKKNNNIKCIIIHDRILTNGKIFTLNATFLTKYSFDTIDSQAFVRDSEKKNQGIIPVNKNNTRALLSARLPPGFMPKVNTTHITNMNIAGLIIAQTTPK
jgi:hypothetical protein